MPEKTAYRLIKRYTYNQEVAGGFPSYESADAFNRKHFIKEESFGPECYVEGVVNGKVYRGEDGEMLVAPVNYY